MVDKVVMNRVEMLVIHQCWESNCHGGEEEDCNHHHATRFLSKREMGRKRERQQQPDKGDQQDGCQYSKIYSGEEKDQ